MRKIVCFLIMLSCWLNSYCWGFYGHKKINELAVFLLPPEMLVLYKPNIKFLVEHATDPDKRKGLIKNEGSRHFIDIDHYGNYPYDSLPRHWEQAIDVYTEDSLIKYGIIPWHIEKTFVALTYAFKEKDLKKILKLSADIGHYIADAHVPLHTSSNHNGLLTNQEGIHGLWESRIPELLLEKHFNLYTGSARYIKNTQQFIWDRVLESASEADSVLSIEKTLSKSFPSFEKYAFEKRNKKIVKVYSMPYTIEFNKRMDDMVARRMASSIYSTASIWLTAWVNAGQPDLKEISKKQLTTEDLKEFEKLEQSWKKYNFEGNEICE